MEGETDVDVEEDVGDGAYTTVVEREERHQVVLRYQITYYMVQIVEIITFHIPIGIGISCISGSRSGTNRIIIIIIIIIR
jgi:hypothetical protein